MKDDQCLYIEWLKVLAVPVTIACIGLYGDYRLNSYKAIEANDRLFVELMSEREQADSALRKEMFSMIINIFLGKSQDGNNLNSKGNDNRIERQILALELLVCNFNEALDLRPLFKQVDKNISLMESDTKKNKSKYILMLKERLSDLAKENIEKQILMISMAEKPYGGNKTERMVIFNDLKKATATATATGKANPQGAAKWDKDSIGTICLKNKKKGREYSAKVMSHDPKVKRLQISLDVFEHGKGIVEGRRFWVGDFDFPMLENTRLPDDERVAVVMTDWFDVKKNDGGAKIQLMYFPGSYASLKEKPYYAELLKEMLKSRENASDM